jgi:hypothetical protein
MLVGPGGADIETGERQDKRQDRPSYPGRSNTPRRTVAQLGFICLARIGLSTVMASSAVMMSSTATMMNTDDQLPVVCLM